MPITINRLGSMLTVFFNKGPVNDFDQASASNTECFGAFFRGMLQQGIYLPCSQFEAAFISGVMQSADITQTINAAHSVFRDLVKQGYTRV